MEETPLLQLHRVTIEVRRQGAWLPAVREASFTIGRGERVALVGESGSGKSLTAMSVGRLLPEGARIRSGRILFRELDLSELSAEDMRAIRGQHIGFIFQNPTAALDPTMTVGRQIAEALEAHGIGTPVSRSKRSIELLTRVGIPDASHRADDHPHEFSGGMHQRVMVASALAAEPNLLIADEPTSALDVTIQAQILELLHRLSMEMHLAILFITHDLAVAQTISERVIVMYAGRILENGPSQLLLKRPHHPYTQALLALAPRSESERGLLSPIPGMPASAWQVGDGCPFAPRCDFAEDRCSSTPWSLSAADDDEDHRSACIIPPEMRRSPAPSQESG